MFCCVIFLNRSNSSRIRQERTFTQCSQRTRETAEHSHSTPYVLKENPSRLYGDYRLVSPLSATSFKFSTKNPFTPTPTAKIVPHSPPFALKTHAYVKHILETCSRAGRRLRPRPARQRQGCSASAPSKLFFKNLVVVSTRSAALPSERGTVRKSLGRPDLPGVSSFPPKPRNGFTLCSDACVRTSSGWRLKRVPFTSARNGGRSDSRNVRSVTSSRRGTRGDSTSRRRRTLSAAAAPEVASRDACGRRQPCVAAAPTVLSSPLPDLQRSVCCRSPEQPVASRANSSGSSGAGCSSQTSSHDARFVRPTEVQKPASRANRDASHGNQTSQNLCYAPHVHFYRLLVVSSQYTQYAFQNHHTDLGSALLAPGHRYMETSTAIEEAWVQSGGPPRPVPCTNNSPETLYLKESYETIFDESGETTCSSQQKVKRHLRINGMRAKFFETLSKVVVRIARGVSGEC